MNIFPKSDTHFQLILFILLIPVMIFASQSSIDTSDIKYIDIKAGDMCIVCDMEIDANSGIGFLFEGRRVTIDVKHFSDFINNPEKYFYKLQAKVALYDEGSLTFKTGYGWFIVGLWILLALVSAALSANIAMKRCLNPIKWFYTGLIFSLFGLIYLILNAKNISIKLPEKFGKIAITDAPVMCQNCNTFNHPCADKCNNCGSKLQSTSESEVKKI